MKRKYSRILILLAAFTVTVFASAPTLAQRYSGRATAIRTTVGVPLTNPVTTAINDTGPLPESGGNITLASNSTTIANAGLTAGASSANTQAGSPVGTSHSEASVANLNISVLGNTITATSVTTFTNCTCPRESCKGDTTIFGLTVNGAAVTIFGTANQTIILTGPTGAAVGTLVINEHISSYASETVNGLHLNVTNPVTGIRTDIVLASSHADILCTVFPTHSFFSGRAYGIESMSMTQDLVVGTRSSTTTMVADTGPLPGEGGVIGPVVVVGASIPGLITSGTLTSSTSGGLMGDVRMSDSSSNVQNLSATVAGFTITATVLSSQTHCQCSLVVNTNSSCTGGAVITNLLITAPLNGTVTGTVTGAPNETVTLRVAGVAVATLIFNEQTPLSPTTSGAITVNALHITTSTTVPGVSTTQTDTTIASSHSDIECGTLMTSAAGVDISGRVMNSQNRPVSKARITLSSPSGETYSAITNGFGYFTITDVDSGHTYVVDISAKGYTFAAQTMAVRDEVTGVVFVLD
ncbi:MAG TPA: carboxypeptidase-like regulatory domain-containing protein [Pyrinomonadaceae bacterium]|nr:carboxypeptidase-like regulatory domain-containing protein [Pyrinomonadaceae bacterium]